MAVFVILFLIVMLVLGFLGNPRVVGNKIIYVVLTFVLFYIGLKILDAIFGFLGLGLFGGLVSLFLLVALFIFSAGASGSIADKVTKKKR